MKRVSWKEAIGALNFTFVAFMDFDAIIKDESIYIKKLFAWSFFQLIRDGN